jgi:hypothetical protein
MVPSRKYLPFFKSGRPKLRAKPGEFEKDRWITFIVKHIENLGVGTIIHGCAFDNPATNHLGTRDINCHPDRNRPLFFRPKIEKNNVFELNYFRINSDEIITQDFTADCCNEIDLLTKASNL